MRVATSSEGGVAAATAGVVLGGDAGPVIDDGSRAARTCLTHLHTTGSAALLRDRGHTGEGAQSLVISRLEGLMSLREQRGEDNPSHPRQGAQDCRVALLGILPGSVSGPASCSTRPSIRCRTVLICQLTRLRRSATAVMWTRAASAVPGATVSAGQRKMARASCAVTRRIRWAARTFAIFVSVRRIAWQERSSLSSGTDHAIGHRRLPDRLSEWPGQSEVMANKRR